MKTTGNAGGSHNLTLSSRLTKHGDDLDAMLPSWAPACS
jgi:PmbA protein